MVVIDHLLTGMILQVSMVYSFFVSTNLEIERTWMDIKFGEPCNFGIFWQKKSGVILVKFRDVNMFFRGFLVNLCNIDHYAIGFM